MNNSQVSPINMEQAREDYFENEYCELEWEEGLAKCEECNTIILQAGQQDGPDDYRFIYKCNNDKCTLHEEVIDP